MQTPFTKMRGNKRFERNFGLLLIFCRNIGIKLLTLLVRETKILVISSWTVCSSIIRNNLCATLVQYLWNCKVCVLRQPTWLSCSSFCLCYRGAKKQMNHQVSSFSNSRNFSTRRNITPSFWLHIDQNHRNNRKKPVQFYLLWLKICVKFETSEWTEDRQIW